MKLEGSAARKRTKNKIINRLLAIMALLIFIYVPFAGIVNHFLQNNMIKTYEEIIINQDQFDQAIKDAQEYNRILYQTINVSIAGITDSILTNEHYNTLLDLSGNGIMGTIEIPMINVNLPIYHGTSEEILTNAVGHVENTSLPVGGKNTRCVLSAHRGLPSSSLFTRLDELQKGDLFYISVANQTLAYQIIEIMTIEPEDVDKISIQPDKDLVSLVTCTPYGINTHRLVVTGERVPYREEVKSNIEVKKYSNRELIFFVITFIFVIVIGKHLLGSIKRKKKTDSSKKTIEF